MIQPSKRRLRIGISACFMHADPHRAIFKGKTLLYMLEPMCSWLMNQEILTVLIPVIPPDCPLNYSDYVDELDGLILQGGADVAPESYGEKPLHPDWSGDPIRDAYEITLVDKFMKQKKPILGICRGLQLINVARGGSLYQDIATHIPQAVCHRNWDIYDQNFHELSIRPGTLLESIYGSGGPFMINSVHHQAIKKLAPDFSIAAHSTVDGVIEAIQYQGEGFVFGVQWHPEFQSKQDPIPLLDPKPLLQAFLNAVKLQ